MGTIPSGAASLLLSHTPVAVIGLVEEELASVCGGYGFPGLSRLHKLFLFPHSSLSPSLISFAQSNPLFSAALIIHLQCIEGDVLNYALSSHKPHHWEEQNKRGCDCKPVHSVNRD